MQIIKHIFNLVGHLIYFYVALFMSVSVCAFVKPFSVIHLVVFWAKYVLPLCCNKCGQRIVKGKPVPLQARGAQRVPGN